MTETKRVAMSVQRAVDRIGLAQMVELSEVPRRTVQNHAAGICAPSVPALLAYVRACDEAGHPDVGAELLDTVLGLVGRASSLVATPTPRVGIDRLAMAAVAEQGDVVREIEAALEDGEITYVEAGRIQVEVRHAKHANDELAAAVDGVAAATPQRHLSMVAGHA